MPQTKPWRHHGTLPRSAQLSWSTLPKAQQCLASIYPSHAHARRH